MTDLELKVLYGDVQQLGYVKTGIKYGVSDNTIRKWFKTYDMIPPKFKKT